MFGTIARLRPKAGRQADVVAMLDEWQRERAPKVSGAVAGYMMRPLDRPSDLTLVAVFADRASYETNANDPGQDAWYRNLRDLLEDDPAWEDGDYLSGEAGGVGQQKAAVRRYYEDVINRGNLAALDELFAPDCVTHLAGNPEPLVGPAGQRHMVTMFLEPFPDGVIALESLVSEGDRAVARIRYRATQTGPFQGIPPTGRPVDMSGVFEARFAGGQITEAWASPDMLSLLQQLGALPAPGQPTATS